MASSDFAAVKALLQSQSFESGKLYEWDISLETSVKPEKVCRNYEDAQGCIFHGLKEGLSKQEE